MGPTTGANPNTTPSNPAASSEQGGSNPSASSSVSSRYATQLRQMRDMGILDERLSLLALRVSEGDVQTAVDLIMSGWSGEGAEENMLDEE